MPTKYSGTMTELKRLDTRDGPSVVVSYWTNDQGERYEPRLRFVLGEKNRPVKGLTKAQAFAVRDAFNAICAEWGSTAAPAAPKRKAASKAKKASKPSVDLTAQAAADAIADMFKNA